jgi:hypothetical protein
MLNAGLALQYSEQIESALGMTQTQEDKRRLQQTIPKLSVIERNSK